MGEHKQFGKNVTWIEEPDVFVMRCVGVIDGPELAAILEAARDFSRDKPLMFLLSDLSGVTGATASAKKLMNVASPVPNAITVTFGASFPVRVLAEMMYRARRLLGTATQSEEVHVATEAEARAFIERRRKEKAGQAGGDRPSAA